MTGSFAPDVSLWDAWRPERVASLLEGMRAFGLEPLLLATTDRNEIYRSFMSWADLRRVGGLW